MSIKAIISNSIGKVLYAFRCVGWYSYYLKVRIKSSPKQVLLSDEWYLKERFLLIAPHADDELLSSYTLLKRCPKITVYYCGFTGSNRDEKNRKERQREIYNVCKALNIQIIEGGGACDNLADIVKDYDAIVLPSIVDWHEEHRKVSYLLYDMLRYAYVKPKIYSYSVTVPNENQEVIIASSISKKEQNDKYSLFYKTYHSQKFMPIFRFRINERINGVYTNTFAAEFFSHHPIDEWLSKTSHIMQLEANGDKRLLCLCKGVANINNMKKVRKASRFFYEFINLYC